MKALPALSLAIAATLALGGCGKSKTPEDHPAAGGDILPRSVSDDMLPYDTVRSQPELSDPDAGKVSSHPHAGATAAAEDDDAGVVTGDEAPPPEPADPAPPAPAGQ